MAQDSIYQLIEEIVATLHFTLVDCQINYGKAKDTLKIVIYKKDKQITSDDCSFVADIVSRQLDIDDPFERPYDLVVESPGLERELKTEKEYHIFSGREIKLFLSDTSTIVSKEGFIIGTLSSASEEGINFTNQKESFFVPFNDIKKAKLFCDYEQLLKKNK